MKNPKLTEKLELGVAHRLTWKKEFLKCRDNSVKEASVIGLLEFVPGKERGTFMDELYRVLVPEGKATVLTAYWSTAQGFQDYLYEWPPLCEQSFMYFNKAWRETNKLTDRGLKSDFDFTYGYAPTPATMSKSDEARAFSITHYNNAVQNLQLVFTKRP